MIKHFIKIAFRNLGRQKLLALINIMGLSLGLACFLLFLLYSVNEFNYDRFHKKGDNIYRVYRWTEAMNGEQASGDVYLPMPLGPALKSDIPDVQNFVRIQEAWGESFARIDNKVSRLKLSFADASFFSIFSFPLKSGNAASVLKRLNDIVLTETIAKQYFGNENPVGKTIDIKTGDEFETFTITGIAKDIPSNSTVSFEVLGNYDYLPTSKYGKRSVNNWHRSAYNTYVQLRPDSRLASQPERLLAFRRKYYPTEEKEARDAGQWKQKGAPVNYGLQSLHSIHTDTKIWGGDVAPVEAKTIWILLGIAAGVLLIACINFTTLAIGRSAGRAREIGIRKVVGSRRKQLTSQFMAEALLLTIISVLLGILGANLLLPWFNQLSGKTLHFSFIQFPELSWLLIGLTLLVGIIAGSYPALVLSRFNPIEVLKQKIKVGGSNIFTKSLVTFQFILSIGLVACTLIILQQVRFMTGKNPGFNKENIIVVDASGTDSKKIYPLFKQAVSAQPAIASIAGSELGLGEGTGWSRSGFGYKDKQKQVFEYFVDPDYIPLMGMKIIAGRNFDPTISGDTVTSVIVNEAMVKDFGWTIDNAVGQQLKGYADDKTPVVIGVVKNFNYQALKEEIKPQMFHQFSDYIAYKYFIRLKPGDPSVALSALQKSWSAIVPDLPFQYSFLDENLDRFYQSEVRWGKIIGWAGGISVFLACLGLFGLAALAVINRTKEIGIRKVLGAPLYAIMGLLAKDFLKLVIIALVIAAPISWYFMHQWLQDFAYRISIGWWIFILAGFVSLLIAFVTIGFQAIRAGLMNPVKSLRSE
jgi:putative ABC transport system permease protein